MTPEEKRERANIITRLAIATRERIEPATLAVYLEETAGCRVETLRDVCRRLSRTAEWFPKVAEIVSACVTEQKLIAERANTHKLLNAPPPVSEDKQREMIRGLADLVKRRAWR